MNEGRLVLANGCFDILHVGHVRTLQTARGYGTCLVVAMNSDKSVKELKGETRPINNENDRYDVLLALGCVDRVVIFDTEDELRGIIKALRPRVLVKGEDWIGYQVTGEVEMKTWGGVVRYVPLVAEMSTTNLIERIGKTTPSSLPTDG